MGRVSRPRVLFVGHSADRTGPPIGLLHFLRWVRDHAEVDPQILLLQGGDLLDDYREIGPVTILDEWNPSAFFGLLESAVDWGPMKRWRRPVHRAGMRWRLRGIGDVDLVYVNTAWTLRALQYLPEGVPVLSAVHELEVGLDYHLPARVHDLLVSRPSHVMAVSEAVASNLVRRHGIARDDISVHYEMIDARQVGPEARTQRRAELGLDPGSVLVGASGLAHWRKAPDLFVRLARLISERAGGADVRYAWVGGDHDSAE
ncbi:MAG: glycosyltransferase, partial [Actinomycetota bacterium]